MAVVHEPEMLILDEPTSGVDPLARDEFWELLIDLSRDQGVTIFVSTHFMNEAARCDRIALMDRDGCWRPARRRDLINARGVATLEDAFISYLEASDWRSSGRTERRGGRFCRRGISGRARRRRTGRAFSLRRLFAYTIRETLELLRDPIRLGIRIVRHGASDGGVRIRHLDGRQQSVFRGSRSRPQP